MSKQKEKWESLGASLAGGFTRTPNAQAGRALEGARELPIETIEANPNQARKDFNEESLAELAASIKEQGVLQPIVVRMVGKDRYQIIAGERRFRASQIANQSSIPAIVREMNDEEAFTAMAVENLQRQDLSIVEEVNLVSILAKEGVSGRKLAESLHKGKDWVARRRALADHPDLLARVASGELNLLEAMAEIARENNPEPEIEIVSSRDTFEKVPWEPRQVQEGKNVSLRDNTPREEGPTFTASIIPQGGMMPVSPENIEGVRYAHKTDMASVQSAMNRMIALLDNPTTDKITKSMIKGNLELIVRLGQSGLKRGKR